MESKGVAGLLVIAKIVCTSKRPLKTTKLARCAPMAKIPVLLPSHSHLRSPFLVSFSVVSLSNKPSIFTSGQVERPRTRHRFSKIGYSSQKLSFRAPRFAQDVGETTDTTCTPTLGTARLVTKPSTLEILVRDDGDDLAAAYMQPLAHRS